MQTTNSSQPFPTGLCQLTSFALMSANGIDAAQFLHGQLTNDIKSLPDNRAALAGYCSTKGRLLATLLLWKSTQSGEGSIVLEMPGELQDSVQKHLQKFVMRSKVKLNSISDANTIVGILGNATMTQLAEWFPTLPAAAYDVVDTEAGTLVRLTDVQEIARYQWIVPNPLFEQIWPTLSKKLPVLSEHVWSLSEIHAGIPHIYVATQEKFVPQMINYELIDGVNFKKGCYPGQEIVARTHYLGKQKRRMVLARINNAHVQSGMEVFAQDDQSQPCGMVVNAESNDSGGSDCLVEIKTTYLKDAVVQLSSGEICHWLPMPYPLPIGMGEQS